MSVDAPIDSIKISALKDAISRGDYPVDLEKIADALLQAYTDIKQPVLKDIRKSLVTMEASFKSDAKIVKKCANNLELVLSELKSKSLTEELSQSDDLENTIKLIEKLSILNEYKLNLFKDFSKFNIQKK